MDSPREKKARQTKPDGEEQSIKRLRKLVSNWARPKWLHWTEFFGGRELMPHAPRGSKSKEQKKLLRFLRISFKISIWFKNFNEIWLKKNIINFLKNFSHHPKSIFVEFCIRFKSMFLKFWENKDKKGQKWLKI